jgi:hypothetical protein
MNSTYLISDCIIQIIKYLENDIKSIYCCILINKAWSYTTIPFLWRNPFEIISNGNFSKAPKIIQTYILCLSDIDKLHLIYEGFNISKTESAFFDYPSYIKEINCNLVNKSISTWFKKTYFEHKSINEEKENLFIGKIYDMFFSRYNRLYSFEIGLRKYGSFNYPNFSSFLGLRQTITDLQHLGIYFHPSDNEQINEKINEQISKFFKKLLTFQCHNIHFIDYKSCANRDILVYYDEKNIAYFKISELIKLQYGLRLFRYLGETSILNFEEATSVFGAFKTQINSLTHLELRGIGFNDKIIQCLQLFKNLKFLIIINCYQDKLLSEDLFPGPEQLSITKFVFLNNRNMSENLQVAFLKLPNYNLKSLTTDFIDNQKVIDSLNYQFPNIIYLSTRIEKNGFVHMDWISNLTKLSHLILDVSFNVLGYLTYSHIYHFGLLLPSSLKVLHIDNEHFSPHILGNLLKACVEKKISLEILGLHFDYRSRINDSYLHTILDYISRQPDDDLIGLKELRIGVGLNKESLEDIFPDNILKVVKKNVPVFTNKNEYGYWYWNWVRDDCNKFGQDSLIDV